MAMLEAAQLLMAPPQPASFPVHHQLTPPGTAAVLVRPAAAVAVPGLVKAKVTEGSFGSRVYGAAFGLIAVAAAAVAAKAKRRRRAALQLAGDYREKFGLTRGPEKLNTVEVSIVHAPSHAVNGTVELLSRPALRPVSATSIPVLSDRAGALEQMLSPRKTESPEASFAGRQAMRVMEQEPATWCQLAADGGPDGTWSKGVPAALPHAVTAMPSLTSTRSSSESSLAGCP